MQRVLISGFEKFAATPSNPTKAVLIDFSYGNAIVKSLIFL